MSLTSSFLIGSQGPSNFNMGILKAKVGTNLRTSISSTEAVLTIARDEIEPTTLRATCDAMVKYLLFFVRRIKNNLKCD